MSGPRKETRQQRTSGRTSRRLALTATTAGVLTGLYVLYALAINPLIRSATPGNGSRSVAHVPHVPRPQVYTEMAERHLASQPWAADPDCYAFRSEDALLFFQEWEPRDDGTAVVFRPFAMIWTRSGDDENEPPITVASKSAYVRFASKFGLDNPNPGRVIGGSLDGEVRITGPDGLDIHGRDFVFNEGAMRIFSDHAVRFAHGPHRGSGWGLQIELVPDEEARRQDKLAVSGIRSVRLQRDVTMNLQFDSDDGDTGEPSADQDEPRFVNVQSAGSFEFVVATNLATFANNVRVTNPTELGKHDSLQCDLLTLVFEPKEDAPDAEPQPSKGGFEGINSNLQFRRLQAEGTDVVLISEENDLTAHMQRLVYDQQTKVAQLTSGSRVHVLQARSEMQSPDVTLVHDDEGDVTSVWCRGAGRLQQVNEQTGRVEFTAEWQKQLRQYPDPRTASTVVELEGQAVTRQPEDQVGLSAEFIRLWAERSEKSETSSGEFRPQKLLARQNVTMATPDMLARTERLEVWFDSLPPGSDLARPPAISGISRERLQPAIHRVDAERGRISTTSHEQPAPLSPEARNANPLADEGPIEVRADLIQARVLRGEERRDAQVAEILTTGNVHIEQARRSGEPPLQMDGDRMHVLNRSENDQLATVWGAPAHIRDRGMHIEGRIIKMDRGRNTADVEGAGLLQLPANRSLEGEKLAEPKLLDVLWTENMTFDGLTAKFFGSVQATLDESQMKCEEMHVTLNRRLSFTESNGGGTEGETEVQEVHCFDNVTFDSSVYEQQKLVELRRGAFAEFTLNQTTGQTHAQGPGWIKVWRRGDGKRAALAPTTTVRANKPLVSDVSDWEYMRIDFTNQSRGNTKQRYTEFDDRVTIVYGPVDRPLAQLDFPKTDLPENGGWMQCDRLQVRQQPKTDSQNAFIQLTASGNTELEGRTFQAQADTVTYDESKGLYVLKSFGARRAEIWRQTQVGGKVSKVDAQSIWFIPSQNWLKADQATGLDGLQ